METAFITDNIKDLKKLKNIDVLYVGNEFCQNKIPNLKQIEYSYNFAKNNNVKFVLVLPFITNINVNIVNKLLISLDSTKKKTEQV